jgi:hypothetical protein
MPMIDSFAKERARGSDEPDMATIMTVMPIQLADQATQI